MIMVTTSQGSGGSASYQPVVMFAGSSSGVVAGSAGAAGSAPGAPGVGGAPADGADAGGVPGRGVVGASGILPVFAVYPRPFFTSFAPTSASLPSANESVPPAVSVSPGVGVGGAVAGVDEGGGVLPASGPVAKPFGDGGVTGSVGDDGVCGGGIGGAAGSPGVGTSGTVGPDEGAESVGSVSGVAGRGEVGESVDGGSG